MLNLRYKTLVVCLSTICSIIACQNGTSSQSQTSAKKYTQLKQAPLGSIMMLGEPADLDGKAMLMDYIPALDPTKVKVSIGAQDLQVNSSVIGDSNTTASNLFANATANGGYGLLSASLGVAYSQENQASNGGITLLSEGYINYPIDISIKSPKYLLPEAQEILDEDGEDDFSAEYGTGYVSGITIGTKFSFIYKLSSNNEHTKQALAVTASASYGSFASFATSIGAMNETTKNSIMLDVKVKINGLSADIPNLPTCTISNLQDCPTLLQNFTIAYLNNTTAKYDALKQKFEAQSENKQTLEAFLTAFSPAGVGDNSIFGMNNVKFAKYPKIQQDADDVKIAAQNKLMKDISKSAMLAGDSGLIKALNSNKILSDIVSQSSDINSLLVNQDQLAALNRSLISVKKMEKIVNTCFSAGSFKKCDTLLNNKTFLDGKDGTQGSINDYFAKIESYSNNSVLQMQGYYSDVTPSLANFFWLQAKEKGTDRDILIPINLNDRTANKCADIISTSENLSSLSQRYTGLETLPKNKILGSIFRDYDGKKDLEKIPGQMEFMPVPSDLVVYPTYSNDGSGEITSVTRESKLMSNVKREKQTYNDTYACEKVLVWNYQYNRKEEVFKCADTFGDFNGLQFYGNKVSLKDAISYYRDKPIINRGIHQPDLDNMCHDIGARDLTREQPWCSIDNNACLFLAENGSLVYKNRLAGVTAEHGKVPANTMSVSLSPRNGPRFWYYPTSNVDPKSISDTIAGIGDRLIVGNDLQFSSGLNSVFEKKNITLPANCFVTSPLANAVVPDLKWGGVKTEMSCNGKTLSRVLLPDGKYSIKNNEIYMDNWQGWETNNRALTSDSQSFSSFFISDTGAGISCDVSYYSLSLSESNKQLRNQGRWELQFTQSQHENIAGGAHHVRAVLNSNTSLAVPFVFATGAKSGKGATYIEIWKRDGHMLIGSYNAGKSWGEWYPMLGYNADISVPTGNNGSSAFWHNDNAIKIGC